MGRHGHDSWSPSSSASRTRRRTPRAPSSPEQRTPRRPTPDDTHEEERNQRSEGSRLGKKRKEKKPKSNYFHLLLQKAEKSGSTPLAEIRRSQLLQKVTVPGQNKLTDGSVAVAVETLPKLRHLLIALKNLIFRLKGARKSLDGNFDVRNLVWIPATKQIKFWKIKEKDFDKYEEQGGKKDCHSIAEAVEGMLDGYDLPQDLKHWIKLLKTDPYGNKYLVANHMCLLAPIVKLQQFVYLYGELEQLQLRIEKMQKMECSLSARLDRLVKEKADCKQRINRGFADLAQYHELSAKYDAASKEHNTVMAEVTRCIKKEMAIIMAVRCKDTETLKTWCYSAKKNEYLQKVFNHKKGHYNLAVGSIGLIEFGRNCSQHLIDHSIDEQGRVMYSYVQMVTIIIYGFPTLFHEFQEAMCNVGVTDPSFK